MSHPKKFDTAFPASVSVGYQEIKILAVDFLDGTGVYLGDSSEIRIKDGAEPIERVNTMLHELLHAVFNVYGLRAAIKNDEDTEEHLVNALGNGLTEIFLRNKDLLKWIQAQL